MKNKKQYSIFFNILIVIHIVYEFYFEIYEFLQ